MTSRYITTYSKVTVKIGRLSRRFILVPSTEIDVRDGKISIDSPVGKALLNKMVKDKVSVRTPIGDQQMQIVDII